jgi:hypothetical protein
MKQRKPTAGPDDGLCTTWAVPPAAPHPLPTIDWAAPLTPREEVMGKIIIMGAAFLFDLFAPTLRALSDVRARRLRGQPRGHRRKNKKEPTP